MMKLVPARRILVPLLIIGALSMTACGGSGGDDSAAAPSTSSSTTTTTATTAPPDTTTTTVPEAPTTTTTVPPPPTEPVFHRGDEGPEVGAIEERLTALGFRPGDVDGIYSAQTASAVMAFQKFEGIDRDGVAGPDTLSHLQTPIGAGPRGGTAAHIEIDLDRQILFAHDGASVSIINISSGTGRRYNDNGVRGVAYTPTGDFTIERRIEGYHKAPLGTLYRPLFFLRGWAIHGSSNVPGYPASHGCVRTSNADQDFLWPTFANGTPVVVYSGDPAAPSEETTPVDAEPGA